MLNLGRWRHFVPPSVWKLLHAYISPGFSDQYLITPLEPEDTAAVWAIYSADKNKILIKYIHLKQDENINTNNK